MKYYEVTIASGDSRCCYPHIKEDSGWVQEGLGENECKEIHELPIPLVVENKYEPKDYLLSNINIVSKKAFDLLKKLNKNLTGFESQMYYKGEKIWDVYYTIVFPQYEVMNMEKSEYKTLVSRVTQKTFVSKIKKLVFDSSKLKKITDENFFAMEEDSVGFYCTEIGKQAIEEAGLAGFDFEEVAVE